MAVFVVLQILVAVVFVVAEMGRDPHADLAAVATTIGNNGLLIGISTLVSAVPCAALVVLFSSGREGSAKAYLGLGRLELGAALLWLAALAVLLVGSDLLSLAADQAVVPEFMLEACSTAGFLPVLLVALIVAAPVFEELLFRGFLFRGIEASPLGAVGAVIVTAAVWAAIHLQYSFFHMGLVFAMGIFLGVVRQRTGSTTLTVLLHAATNTVATVQALAAAGVLGSWG
jgi:membrane protease YdiL (CAAX protease family)